MLFDENHLTIHWRVINLWYFIPYCYYVFDFTASRHFLAPFLKIRNFVLFLNPDTTQSGLLNKHQSTLPWNKINMLWKNKRFVVSLSLHHLPPKTLLYFIFPLPSPSLHFPSVSFPQPLLLWKARFFKRKNRRTFLDVTFEISTGSISGKKN